MTNKPPTRLFLVEVLLLVACAAGPQPAASVDKGPPVEGALVERLSPAINRIIPADAKLERVVTGMSWAEGPVWTPAGYLLFADIRHDRIMKWTPGTGASVFMHPSCYLGKTPYPGPQSGSDCMTLDPRGLLTVAGHAQRDLWRLERLDPHGVRTILADRFHGKRLNGPDDLVYGPHGALDFTDPPYGLPTQSGYDPLKEFKVNGVYCILDAVSHPAGAPPDESKLQLLISNLARPDGLAFSPHMKYLYVDSSAPNKIWVRYPVRPDGTLGPGRLFYNATASLTPGDPDGIKVDERGNIYTAGPGDVLIFSLQGEHLGTIRVPEEVTNLAWGPSDGSTLYITAASGVYQIGLMVPGVRP